MLIKTKLYRITLRNYITSRNKFCYVFWFYFIDVKSGVMYRINILSSIIYQNVCMYFFRPGGQG